MTVYQGPTNKLIVTPADVLMQKPSRLVQLARTYSCAASYANTARNILVKGHVPDGYPLLSLFTPPQESTDGAISTYFCTYYGVASALDFAVPYVTRSSQVKHGNLDNLSFSYVAPILTKNYVLPAGSAVDTTHPTPEEVTGNQSLQYFDLIRDNTNPLGYTSTYFTQMFNWAGRAVNLVSVKVDNFGAVDEVTIQFDISLIVTSEYGIGPYDDLPKPTI